MPNKLTTDEFIEKAHKLHGDKYDYHKIMFVGYNSKITIICKIHGDFYQKAGSHLEGHGCKICGVNEAKIKKSYNTNKFIKKAKEKHGETYNYSRINYINSQTKIILICKKHGEFAQSPNNHLYGHGCPTCAIKKRAINRILSSKKFIDKAKKIHGDKYDYSLVSYTHGKNPVIIVCKKHGKFTQRSNNHLKGAGCPFCGRIRTKSLDTDPILQAEFHPDLNGNSTPEDYYLGSKIKIWWKCKKGHIWKSAIRNRSYNKSGCPFCTHKKITPENSLALYPELAKEIHPTLNKITDPAEYAHRTSKKIWWLCKNGHSWKTCISTRTNSINPSGCPFCRIGKQISFLELRVFIELKKKFLNIIPKEKELGCECDIFIPELNLAIEIDGHYWHKNREKEDIKKTDIIKNNGRKLIHLREEPLNLLTENDIHYKKADTHLYIIKNLFKKINAIYASNLDIQFLDETEYKNNLYVCYPELSLAQNYPELIKEWNVNKNGVLTPEKISSKSGIKVWWKCNKGHEWEAVPHNRVRGAGCPFCSGRFSTPEKSLLKLFPEIAIEWNYELNKIFTLKNISYGSSKKINWICKICGNKWCSKVVDRTGGHGCPKCHLNKRRLYA